MTSRQLHINVPDPEAAPDISREWLVTNGLGGYASGTVIGLLTRRYHGLLIAAFSNPLGRTMMLNGLAETIRLADHEILVSGTTELMGLHVDHTEPPMDFYLEEGLPVWRYSIDHCVIEKRIFMPHGQNMVYVTYKLIEGDCPVTISLRPGVNFRSHDALVSKQSAVRHKSVETSKGLELSADGYPPLWLQCDPPAEFHDEPLVIENVIYPTEASRGYDSHGSLWSPGYFEAEICTGQLLTFIAHAPPVSPEQPLTALATELTRRKSMFAALPPELTQPVPVELIYAADQFVITPQRTALPGSDISRTVIAGYHWFTDWGRDTMISLEGLTLVTRRYAEAAAILRTFAYYIRDGLIPNMFPEGEAAGLYHTADATLWFFHAIARYLAYTHDAALLNELLPHLDEIISAHIKGTRFNIRVDPDDGLLIQGAFEYQLTWMDAKVGDWVVTPRRGKAVEINALWYNALCNMAAWHGESSADQPYTQRAAQVRESFNRRFWRPDAGYLFDVVDGEAGPEPGKDAACRPNQIFAISLPNPVLDPAHWSSVLNVVTEKLLTPVGLRSLAPGEPGYTPKYFGNLWSRDAAYHQGTVWAWLIGPYIDAWLKVNPGRNADARKFLSGFVTHLKEAGIGTISEIFDAEQPHIPRGCIAQAWSVAEVLRCWRITA
jgi:predicted glycogen debranching enzyme